MATQDVFKALADPTRRQILKILQAGSCNAGDLAAHFAMTKGTLSHHFAILKQADLVRTERQGQQIIYAINTSVLEDTARLIFDLVKFDHGDTP